MTMPSRRADFSLQPLRGLIDFGAPTIHHVLDLAASDRLTIVTSPQPWAYAISFALNTTSRRTDGRILIRVNGWVSSGRVGVGLVRNDGRTYVEEVLRTPNDGLTHFDLWTDSLAECQAIVVRNAAEGESEVTLESITVYRWLSTSATVTARWIENRQAIVPIDLSGGPAAPEVSEGVRETDGDPQPWVSLVLTVKNGMPYLPQAIESLRGQRYTNFELIVQDGRSSDGTLDYLRGITDIETSITSEQDTGIGDARSRAYARCRTDIVGSIDADNVLQPDALSIAVAIFRDHPEAAAVYGAVEMINPDGSLYSRFVPDAFDLLKVACCELVPPWSTAFFSRRVCGPHLFFDPAIPGCVDYDTWLRLGHLPILQIDTVLGCTRLGSQSVSCGIENYGEFCEEKIRSLQQYLRGHKPRALSLGVLRYGIAGIYCWAAESLQRLGASRPEVEKFIDLALQTDPASERAKRLQARVPA